MVDTTSECRRNVLRRCKDVVEAIPSFAGVADPRVICVCRMLRGDNRNHAAGDMEA